MTRFFMKGFVERYSDLRDGTGSRESAVLAVKESNVLHLGFRYDRSERS